MNEEPQQKEIVPIQEQLNIQQEALTKIYASVEKTRKMIMWSGIVSLVLFILPLLVIAFAFPFIIKTLTGSTSGVLNEGYSTQTINHIPSLSESLENLKGLGY